METREYHSIDKSTWGKGDWQGEPDKVQWPEAATGLPCLAVRHPSAGHWCGYVGVAPGHPLHGKDYDAGEVDVTVHGGLTFADACAPSETEARGVCHVPGAGEPHDVWWFGFDCAHCGDLSPAFLARQFAFRGDSYRTLRYVQDECAALAAQLAGPR